jgi:hypothetical protein
MTMDLRRMNGVIVALSIFCAMVLVTGCGPKVRKFYSADQLGSHDIAIIDLKDGKIVSIDEKRCFDCIPSALRNMEVHVPPGEHELVYALVPSPYEGPRAFWVKVNVEGGKRYILREHRFILSHDPFHYGRYRDLATQASIRCLSLRNPAEPKNAVLYTPLDPEHKANDFLISQYMDEIKSPRPKAVIRMDSVPY